MKKLSITQVGVPFRGIAESPRPDFARRRTRRVGRQDASQDVIDAIPGDRRLALKRKLSLFVDPRPATSTHEATAHAIRLTQDTPVRALNSSIISSHAGMSSRSPRQKGF